MKKKVSLGQMSYILRKNTTRKIIYGNIPYFV
jgi:hypothetical protein